MHIDHMNAMNKAVHRLYKTAPALKGNVIAMHVKPSTKLGLLAQVKKLKSTGQHIFMANASYFKGDGPSFSAKMKKNEELKFHPAGACNAKGIFNHEMGHILCSHFGTSKTDEIYHLFHELTSDEVRDHLSQYATKDRHEFVAEAWSEYTTSPKPRPLAVLVGRFLEDQVKGEIPAGKAPLHQPGGNIKDHKIKAHQWFGDVLKQIRGAK